MPEASRDEGFDQSLQGEATNTVADAAAAAQFIFFERCGATRVNSGIFTISLVADKVIPYTDGTAKDAAVCVGYLKGTEEALLNLAQAIGSVLELKSALAKAAN